MVRLENRAILERDIQDEYEHPLPQKHVDGRVIYLSRNNYGRISTSTGVVQITDFGLSVWGNKENHGCIQADIYRAPEVTVDAGYSYALGSARRSEDTDDYDEALHLAQITALLGSPPKGLLVKGRRTFIFYHPDGTFKTPTTPVPQTFTFANSLSNFETEQDKQLFTNFVRRMLKWAPEERSTARELLSDPWLRLAKPSDG
ncbi:putative serine/threonine-protein kinase dyrk2-like protein [Cladobotryum mycophilum]|uniref:non-specific serine/threonine protein kinase n=1 Tax=Cladobotryum mycophilum TaxID=491253 RepID=A0ABR0SX32_9HYPO